MISGIEIRHDVSALNGTFRLLHPEVVLPLWHGYRRTTDKIAGYSRKMRWMLAGKRAFDIGASIVLIALLSPLLILLLIWIPLDSPGDPIFSHARIGLHGRTFRIFKFRTMRQNAHAQRELVAGIHENGLFFFKDQNDPRITRLGRFLRKYSLDELPQLVNVLGGDMSLIGPRPLVKEDFAIDPHASPLFRRWARHRHGLPPGITGLWQVSGRSELSFEESMRIDLKYVVRWSPWLDAKIVFMTPLAVLAGKGAY